MFSNQLSNHLEPLESMLNFRLYHQDVMDWFDHQMYILFDVRYQQRYDIPLVVRDLLTHFQSEQCIILKVSESKDSSIVIFWSIINDYFFFNIYGVYFFK